ncbi:type IV secretory system conjugative DNA transfer family protein [Desulfovibrio ferrophilus]|uniref:Type IV secretory system Conjugative DNA transfer family protein n=1 Tax=Desulfovibrio ferrophilus TaxID=241368 RepID=A0A2Z6B424_9BACT|nr:type IV secretory system conjugative DNA transfer family protein [Desulfovibrio ferrophilus]BBD10148.1 type IV secretory system Conjugative DNA transfer family protein [Desulfovibrio ferrophilus]
MKHGLSHIWIMLTPFFVISILTGSIAVNAKTGFDPRAMLKVITVWPWPLWLKYTMLAAIAGGTLWIICNPFAWFHGKNEYGGAHWAKKKELKKKHKKGGHGLLGKTGLIIGVYRKGLRRYFLRIAEPLSVLIHAGPGTGKTAGVIIPALLSCEHSAVIHDSKGEIHDLTHHYRGQWTKVIRFAPGEPESARWNPLAATELPKLRKGAVVGSEAWTRWWEQVEIVVERIGVSLLPNDKADQTDHWTQSARAMWTFWCLMDIYENSESSVPAVLDRALMGDRQISIEKALMEHEDDPHLPSRVFKEGTRFRDMEQKQFDSVTSTFEAKLQVYLSGTVARNVSSSDFSIRELRREPTTIYVVIKEADQERLKGLISAFFEQCALVLKEEIPNLPKDSFWARIKRGLGMERGKVYDQRITYFLDEFVRLARMDEVLTIPDTGRGYGMSAIFVAQSIHQLAAIYGDKRARQLLDTCSYRIVYSQSDQQVCNEISKAIGNQTRIKKTRQQNRATITGGSTSEVSEGVPLILPQDIGTLEVKRRGRCLIIKSGLASIPVDAEGAFWFKYNEFKRLINDKKAQKAERQAMAAEQEKRDAEPLETAEEIALNKATSLANEAKGKAEAARVAHKEAVKILNATREIAEEDDTDAVRAALDKAVAVADELNEVAEETEKEAKEAKKQMDAAAVAVQVASSLNASPQDQA